MPTSNHESNKKQDVVNTPTCLYPSSDNSVMLTNSDYEKTPFKTGKHSRIPDFEAHTSANKYTQDEFAPKQQQSQIQQDIELPHLRKKNKVFKVLGAILLACVVIFVAIALDGVLYQIIS